MKPWPKCYKSVFVVINHFNRVTAVKYLTLYHGIVVNYDLKNLIILGTLRRSRRVGSLPASIILGKKVNGVPTFRFLQEGQ